MSWYRTGTVTVANGSATVIGAGTDFVSNVVMGDGFRGPDGRTSEIARVVSATELTLAEGYAGPGAGGQPYAIQPTQSYIRDLAQNAATLLNTFAVVRDGIGQGLIGDGTLAAPGIRFANDPDTGFFRTFPNVVGVSAGGTLSAYFSPGSMQSQGDITLIAPKSAIGYALGDRTNLLGNSVPNYGVTFGVDIGLPGAVTVVSGYGSDIFMTGGVERARIDISGNLLVGVAAGAYHRIEKGVATGTVLMARSSSTGQNSITVLAAGAEGYSLSECVLQVGRNGGTGRSINAGGTINASGADYAEYMSKADGCGTIAPGDVCGVDVAGKLTRTWADARSFVVKSTDPAYVGGDSWAAGMAPRPEAPGDEPTKPAAIPPRPENEAELESWRTLADAYPEAFAAWTSDHTEWQAASDAYERDLLAWEAALEVERVKVDRIAFCGQVPINVTGDFAVGDYLIAAPAGAGIKAVAIAAADITFEQYRRRLGKVWAVRNGRAWVDVQHG